jgi:two-component system nitrate/nitrite response regulator NarL
MAEAAQSVTVLAVDDQPIFLRTARSLIAATPGFEQVGEAASGLTAIELVEQRRPDHMLLDVRMPGMDGVETARRIHEAHPGVVVVLISIDESPAVDPELEASGAAEMVRKQDFGPTTLRRLWRAHGERGH